MAKYKLGKIFFNFIFKQNNTFLAGFFFIPLKFRKHRFARLRFASKKLFANYNTKHRISGLQHLHIYAGRFIKHDMVLSFFCFFQLLGNFLT